ncbi:MAG: Gfo/Idh/MocA family oxidoreductase [Clostridiales bacterium]|jgi:predicted dehydrogenase|nr:Gfo/Idh/MocA family oxidoreductase [Clostridiales bacterium]
MDKNKVKVAIIGAGNIAQSAHIPSYKKLNDVEILGVCDINLDRARDVANRYDIKYVSDKYQEILDIEEIDAVSICTTNDAHAEIAIAAAKAGKHILCEKPMAMNVKEAEDMTKAARDNNIIFMMGFVNRFRADSKLIKELAEAGKFGEIYYAKTGILRRRGTPLGWFTNLAKSGGGPVIDIGVHVIDLTWYFMGKPKPISVSAATYSKIGDYKTKGVSRWVALDADNIVFETEDSASAFIRFENGATMTVDVSWAINGKETGVYSYIYGTKAGASLEPLMIYDEQENYLFDSAPVINSENSFVNEISHFIECIQEGKETIAPAEDGLEVQKILNGIYDSAKLGKEVIL